MKRLIAVLFALVLFAVPAFAGIPAKSELGLVGEFIKLDGDGPDPWTVNVDLLFPVSESGHLLIGPAVAVGQDDNLNRLGGAFEWNLVSAKHGPFIGASAYGFQKDTEGMDRHTVVARAGFKFGVGAGNGAAIKVYAFQIVDGRGADESDLSVAAGIVARF